MPFLSSALQPGLQRGCFLDVTQHPATGDLLNSEQQMACGLQASEAVFLLEPDVLSERSWTVAHSAQGTSRGFAQPEVWQVRPKVPTQITQQEAVGAGGDFLRSQPGTGPGIFLQHLKTQGSHCTGLR